LEDPVGSAAHRDVKDDFTVFNVVAPFSNYKGGDLVLWGLRMRVEMRRGDVFFFYGSLISHNVTAVEGDRNSVNLFTHHSTLVLADGVLKGENGSGLRAEKTSYGQDWESVPAKRQKTIASF
jgi:hypothetical protein